jgi:hypothetical protein
VSQLGFGVLVDEMSVQGMEPYQCKCRRMGEQSIPNLKITTHETGKYIGQHMGL